MKALLGMASHTVPLVFGDSERRRLAELVDIDLDRTVTSIDELSDDECATLEILITGWGGPTLGPRQLDRLTALRSVVHWGGGIGFVDPSATSRGLIISSARAANAIPVAEFTVALMVLAAKDAFWMSRRYVDEQRFIDREVELPTGGLYHATIGIIGASSIGTLVIDMLRSMDVDVLLFDPTVAEEDASRLGVELVDDLHELARRVRILSIHAPEIPATIGMVSRDVLAALPDGATVINTARGALIDQDALVRELQAGRIRAVLDVTEPDVLEAGHPLYFLNNVFLTPHLAGSVGLELRRLGEAAVDEVARFVDGGEFANPMSS